MRRWMGLLLAAALLLILPAALSEERLAFTEKTLTGYVGETFLLPLNRDPEGVTFTSSAPGVASVDETGLVTPKKKGSATLYAAVRGENGKVQRTNLRLTVRQRVEAIDLGSEFLYVPLGQTRTLEAAVSPASSSNRKLHYASTNEEIATVNSRAGVTGKKLGQCTVTVTSDMEPGISRQCTVVVVNPVSSIKIEIPKGTALWVGETYQLQPQVLPQDATHPLLTYASKNEKVATVDENGLVTGVGRGTATLTLKAQDGSRRSATVKISVKQPPTSVTLKTNQVTLAPGQSAQIKATVLPKNANSNKVEWYSTDERVATVNQKGRVKAIGVGTCQIVCRCVSFPGVFAVCDVSTLIPMTHVALTEDSLILKAGETCQAIYAFEPADATQRPMLWTSGNPGVASVDENGRIKALAAGHTTITLTSPDNKKVTDSLMITVTQGIDTLTLKPDALTLKAGEAKRLHGVVTPRHANGELVWRVSDETVAHLAPSRTACMLTALRPGMCTVTVSTADGSLSSQCTVTVE